MPREIVIEKELLEALRLGNQYKVKEICEMFNCSKSAVETKLYKYKIPAFWPDKYNITDNELRRMYYDDNMTMMEIAKILGCSKGGIRHKFKRANIKTKEHYLIGKKVSIETRRNLSNTRKRLYKEGKLISWNKDKTHLDDDRILVGENASNFSGIVIFPVCPVCGNIFEISNSHYNSAIKQGWLMHCSKSCSAIDTLGPQDGDNNANWKGGYFPYYSYYFKRIRDYILNRADNKSELTGNVGEIMDVHHIYPFRLFMEEYIALCREPHIPYIKNKSFKVIPYDIVPDVIFEEANRENNLIVLTRQEHGEIEKLDSDVRLMLRDIIHNKLSGVNQ